MVDTRLATLKCSPPHCQTSTKVQITATTAVRSDTSPIYMRPQLMQEHYCSNKCPLFVKDSHLQQPDVQLLAPDISTEPTQGKIPPHMQLCEQSLTFALGIRFGGHVGGVHHPEERAASSI